MQGRLAFVATEAGAIVNVVESLRAVGQGTGNWNVDIMRVLRVVLKRWVCVVGRIFSVFDFSCISTNMVSSPLFKFVEFVCSPRLRWTGSPYIRRLHGHDDLRLDSPPTTILLRLQQIPTTSSHPVLRRRAMGIAVETCVGYGLSGDG